MSKEQRKGKLHSLPEVPGFISINDLATVWNVSVAHVHLMVSQGRLAAFRLGNQIALPLGVPYPDPIVPVAREAMKRKAKRDADMARRAK